MICRLTAQLHHLREVSVLFVKMPPYSLMSQSEAVTANQRDLRFVDYIPPNFQTARSTHNERGTRRYIAIFDRYDGGSPTLTYVEYDGNEQALARLQWIALNNNDEEYDVQLLNLDAPLPESVVDDLMGLTEDALRTVLSEHVSPPKPDGWQDSDQWHVLELLHFRLDGQVAMLPPHPPVSFPPEWENYACHLFSFYLKDYTRPWP